MANCWCGSEIDDLGMHITIPDGNDPWADGYFSKVDDRIIHHTEKLKRGS